MPTELSAIRVLLVEDDAIDRDIFKKYLRQTGSYVFQEASTGAQGLGCLEHFRPTCVLLDYNLPDMNGLEFMERVSSNGHAAGFPVVMLTAVGNERVAVEAMKLGAMDYLAKGGVTPDSVSRAVRNAIEKFSLQQDLAREREKLVEREAYYRTLLEAIPQVVWTASTERVVDFVNTQWFEYTGLRELTPEAYRSAIHPQDLERLEEAWTTAAAAGQVLQAEARLRRHDGAYRWHLARAVMLRRGDTVLKWFGTWTDLEDQKRAEAALLQKQKLESIGLLAGGIAHDFNNLLVAILGGASLALDLVPAANTAFPLLQGIVDASERAAHLTRQMLAYAGKGNFLIERIDLSDCVLHTAELVRISIPKNVEVKLQAGRDLPDIQADAGQVQQVVMNLVINAAESVPEERQGLVVVRTRVMKLNETRSTNLAGGTVEPGEYVVLEVEDNGTGMSEETLSRIFDPFFSTKFTGRGLGLAAVQGILRALKGGIEVETHLGEGTIFRIYFPAHARLPVADSSPPSERQQIEGAILVIDDEAMVREVARTALDRIGRTALTAATGEEGLKLLAENKDRIALVLLDMSMPGMSGPEVLKRMRAAAIQVPVIICSGYSEEEVYRQFAGLDVAAVIQKPFTIRRFASKFAAVLGGDGSVSG
ncbi:MAG: response regulator [Acidobacteriia bacterium]|nr:response regulator [Terriglobia bacterium]